MFVANAVTSLSLMKPQLKPPRGEGIVGDESAEPKHEGCLRQQSNRTPCIQYKPKM